MAPADDHTLALRQRGERADQAFAPEPAVVDRRDLLLRARVHIGQPLQPVGRRTIAAAATAGRPAQRPVAPRDTERQNLQFLRADPEASGDAPPGLLHAQPGLPSEVARDPPQPEEKRSEERRGGKECVITWRSRWSGRQ